jgi:hypothetical protein
MARRELVDAITVATRHGGAGLGPVLEAPRVVLGRARLELTAIRADNGEQFTGKLSLRLAPVVVDQGHDFGGGAAGTAGAELDALAVFALGSQVAALGLSGVVLAVTPVAARGRVERVDVVVG